jgi:hypothetical protein
VLERDGVRWIVDLSVRPYHSMERAGVAFFDRRQDADRWKVFETSPFSHSTLTLDSNLHTADAFAPILEFSPERTAPSTTVDLTATLGLETGRAHRTFALKPDRQLELRDDLRGLSPGTRVRWALPTPADVTLDGGTATLTRDGKTLALNLVAPADGAFRVEELTRDDPPWTLPIPGVRMLIADFTVPASGDLTIDARFGGD